MSLTSDRDRFRLNDDPGRVWMEEYHAHDFTDRRDWGLFASRRVYARSIPPVMMAKPNLRINKLT